MHGWTLAKLLCDGRSGRRSAGGAWRPGGVRQVGQLIEHFPERGQIAAKGIGAGGQVTVRVHAYPGDVVPGVVGELGEERPLGAAVALAERVQGVDVSEEPGQGR